MPRTGWRNWYHCTVGTYGTWLPGDPRGWRERDHHEHVAGDYKDPPPPSKFAAARWQHSKDVMRFDPYLIESSDRAVVGRFLLESLSIQKIPILGLAVCRKDFHALLQFEKPRGKRILGEAKKHATFRFAPILDAETKKRRPIWEGDECVIPIKDRAHGLEAFHYILKHVREGGWVWSYKDATAHASAARPAPTESAGLNFYPRLTTQEI